MQEPSQTKFLVHVFKLWMWGFEKVDISRLVLAVVSIVVLCISRYSWIFAEKISTESPTERSSAPWWWHVWGQIKINSWSCDKISQPRYLITKDNVVVYGVSLQSEDLVITTNNTSSWLSLDLVSKQEIRRRQISVRVRVWKTLQQNQTIIIRQKETWIQSTSLKLFSYILCLVDSL